MDMNPQKAANGLADKAHAGTEKVAGMAHDLVDNIADKAENLEENIKKGAKAMESKAKESLETVREKSVTFSQSVSEFVKQHPLASIGIAIGLGLVASALSKRDSSSE